jgi:hypothetical protein
MQNPLPTNDIPDYRHPPQEGIDNNRPHLALFKSIRFPQWPLADAGMPSKGRRNIWHLGTITRRQPNPTTRNTRHVVRRSQAMIWSRQI